jgi:hypothetical protein
MRAKALLFSLVITVLFAAGVSAQQNTYKITQTMSMEGMPQPMTTTTYVKGSRKRTEQGAMMGMGGDVATIEQCDLKQTVQVNDKKKLYHIEAMNLGGDETPVSGGRGTSTPVKKGGTVTVTNSIVDTGERKQMFGFTARHVKTSMSMQSSPDACTQGDMKMEIDAWYIDLPELSCPIPVRPMQYGPGSRGGCNDRYVYHNSGAGKTGFPLEQTMTMAGGMTQTIHTVDLSRAPLDQALFNVPGSPYQLVSDTNQLYGQPDMSAMMNAMKNGGNRGDDDNNNRSSGNMGNMGNTSPAFNGIKVAVLMPTNRGENISTADLQNYLIERITGGNVMAMAASSEAEARSMGANYILWTDISKLKQSTGGKIGGMFGHAVGVPTGGAGNYDAQVDYKLVKLADGSTALSSKASSKTENNAQAAAEAILGQEASAVLGAAK